VEKSDRLYVIPGPVARNAAPQANPLRA